MEVDPAASMRCWAIDIDLGGRTFEVPALPAADWWPIVRDPDRLLTLPWRPTDGERVELDDWLLQGETSLGDIGALITDTIADIAGRSFHAAYLLALLADQHWPVIGAEIVKTGFRWDVQPIGAALDLIYSIILSILPEKTDDGRRPREEFLQMLNTDPTDKGVSSKAVEDFEAMAGPRPTGRASATAGQYAGERPRTQQRRPQPLPAAP